MTVVGGILVSIIASAVKILFTGWVVMLFIGWAHTVSDGVVPALGYSVSVFLVVILSIAISLLGPWMPSGD